MDMPLRLVQAEIVEVNKYLPASEQRRGGFLCVLPNIPYYAEPVPLMIAMVGKPTASKERKYLELCQEKAIRLMANEKHLSSWQTRHLDHQQYGGAIRAGDFIFGFSGLIELADEAVLLMMALEIGLLSKEEVVAIAQISGNNLISV